MLTDSDSPLHKLFSLIHDWTLTPQSPYLVWPLGMGAVKQTQGSDWQGVRIRTTPVL